MMTAREVFLAIAILVIGMTVLAEAQTQSSKGACSPNVAGSYNRVTVTCTLRNHRILIAKYEGEVTNESHDDFFNFLTNNDGVVVNLDLYLPDNQVETSEDRTSITFVSYCPGTKEECGSWLLSFSSDPSAYFANGAWYIKGFFIPTIVHGIHQGQIATDVEVIDRNRILFSDKYVVR
jgi:hypothetical protein